MGGMKNEPLKSMFPTHFVVEVNIKQVTQVEPGQGNANREGTREIDDTTRVITKAANLAEAIEKAQKVLDIEKPDPEMVVGPDRIQEKF